MKIGEMLITAAEKSPRGTALIFKGQKTTYKQMLQHVCKVSNSLKANGVETGAKVAIFMDNRAEYLFSYYAIQMLGEILIGMGAITEEGAVIEKVVVTEDEAIAGVEVILAEEEENPEEDKDEE